MPVQEKEGKFYVKDEEFDTQDEANKAYMKYLADMMGVEEPKKKKKTKKDEDEANDSGD